VEGNGKTATNNHINRGGSELNDTGIDGNHVFTGEHLCAMNEIRVFTINAEMLGSGKKGLILILVRLLAVSE
jgi:hypothetical protein